MSAQVAALQRMLEQRFPDAVPVAHRTAEALATGIAALDGALPGGGLPRGRMSAWAPGGGTAAMLRAACAATAARAERAVWIDGGGVVTGDFWNPATALVRPGDALRALQCAEELVRCGGFALTVLSAGRVADAERVRLSRAAKEGGGALAVLDGGGFMAGLRICSRVAPEDYRWLLDAFGEPARVESVTVHVRVTAMGWDERTHFSMPVVEHDLRLSIEPGLADRRGTTR